jgi:4a-hydroxytetrahydrobiopterin dehydratase
MNIVRLSDQEIQERLEALKDWSLRQNKIRRDFKFKNFVDCFAFMTELSLTFEKHNHHPNWSNVYNNLTIELTTHDAAPEEGGAITVKDFELAKIISIVYSNLKKK